MNLRQKAKYYKALAEKYKEDSETLKRMRFSDDLKRQEIERQIVPLKIAQYVPDYSLISGRELSEQEETERIKELTAHRLSEFLLENNLIDFEINKTGGFYKNAKRVTATLTVLKPKERGQINE